MIRPKTGTRSLCAVALFALVLSGCASGAGFLDGGVGGTGIGSATIQGNIAGNGVPLANVRVTARGTTISVLTDANGFFTLVGVDPGGVTVEFVRSDDPQPATIDVLAASGSIVTLTDVHLVGATAMPERVELSNIVGQLVEDAECNGSGGSFSIYDGEISFTVVIDALTTIERNRRPVACADLSAGTQVKLRGRQVDQDIVATEVRVLRSGPIAN